MVGSVQMRYPLAGKTDNSIKIPESSIGECPLAYGIMHDRPLPGGVASVAKDQMWEGGHAITGIGRGVFLPSSNDQWHHIGFGESCATPSRKKKKKKKKLFSFPLQPSFGSRSAKSAVNPLEMRYHSPPPPSRGPHLVFVGFPG